jgi:hypothetical protein
MGSRRSSSDANRPRRKSSPALHPETPPQRHPQNPPAQKRIPQSPRDHELTTKRRGELAELAFTLKATTLGFAVSKPYGDSERYDFIVDSHEPNTMPKLSRVQVKCSTQLVDGLYRTNAHRRINGRAVPYKLTEIDFIIAYIIPEDSWFILPLRDILGLTSLLFRRKRDRRPGLYDSYREAWRLLRLA